MENLYGILLDILNIVDYEEDREEFVKHSTIIITADIIEQLMKQLPADQREAFEANIESALSNAENMDQLLGTYFEKAAIEDVSKIALENFFKDYYTTVSPTLTEDQRVALAEYLHKFSTTAPDEDEQT